MGDPGQEAVTVQSYDPRWRQWADQEMRLLGDTLGHRVAGLEHIGSTAVPGMDAKPTVDLMLGTRTWPWAAEDDARLAQVGHQLYEVPDPRWRFYIKARGRRVRGFHLHVVEAGGERWHELLHFRDWLRHHPEDARAYVQLKKQLALRFEHDRLAYQDAKADLIGAILTQAVTPST